MDNKQKITGNITPPNKDMEILKRNFPQCFDKNDNFDFDKFKQELSHNEINFSKESYGLDWLGKSYARLLATDETATLLKENKDFNRKEENQNSGNLLIKGDNLEVLKHLSNAYYEKIKMIYIDPPYNTGSDGFVYQDNRKFTVQQLQDLAGIDEDRAKRILSFTQSKSNSHSAWLTFMYPRLYIAKQLLKDDGVIFISIDDNEVAQLRLLMDEIFGEENFVGETVWQHSIQPKGYIGKFSVHHNYTLVYKKTELYELSSLTRTKEHNINYSNPDNDPNGLWRSGDVRNALYRPNLIYNIITPSGKEISPPPNGWRWSKETLTKKIENGEIIFNKDETKIIRKIYLKNVKGRTPETIWFGKEAGTTREANEELKKLFDNKTYFDTPKPSKLIKRCIDLSSDVNIILDFFAGSGTTADAVMQLNAEDGGNRKYILVQLPEPIDPKKNRAAYDFVKDELKVPDPTIFEITKERIIRAAKKIKEESIRTKIAEKQKEIRDLENQLDIDNKDEKIKQLKQEIKALENQDLGFRIFETMPVWEDYDFEADELKPQQNLLFDETKLTNEDIDALLVTWKTYDGVPLTQSVREIDLDGYLAEYANGKLYLMHRGFKTKNLKYLLEKIDKDKDFSPTVIIAFGYHFESKNLMEISENIKSYANKKNIDIDFIIRY